MRHNWEYKRLGAICDLYQPKTIPSSELVDNGEYDVFGANGIIGKYTSYNHEFPEILLTCRGATCGTINVSTPKSWINGNAMVIHIRLKSLLFDYLRYAMSSLDYSNIITGAAQPQITRQSLAPTNIPVPPREVQERIVAELDKINEVIEECRELLRNLDALAQSLFYDYFGDPVTNPKGWQTQVLSEIAPQHPYKGKFSVDDDLWLLNLDMIEKNTGRIINRHKVKYEDIGNSVYKIGPNQVLYSKLRPNLNKVVIADDFGYCTSELLPLNPHKGLLNCQYLAYLLRTKECVTLFSGKVAGAKMPRTDLKTFRTFQIPIPPFELQEKFSVRIEQIEAQKKTVEETIANLQMLLDSRMDYWFN